MKAISIQQPYASFIGAGLKKYETRTWKTDYRGDLLICSGLKKGKNLKIVYHNFKLLFNHESYELPLLYDRLPFGKALAIVELTDCVLMTDIFIQSQTHSERSLGHWELGNYAWELKTKKIISSSIQIKGQLGLFNVNDNLLGDCL
jgi:hypothetical protein